jgi:hypothetical protein
MLRLGRITKRCNRKIKKVSKSFNNREIVSCFGKRENQQNLGKLLDI